MIIAMLLSIIFLVPIGMIQGITNTQIGLNVLTEFMVGYMLPGRPIAMMLFKTYGYITMAQALYFLQDMKLGHYLKVPVSNSPERYMVLLLIFFSPELHSSAKLLLAYGRVSCKSLFSIGLLAALMVSAILTNPMAIAARGQAFSIPRVWSGE